MIPSETDIVLGCGYRVLEQRGRVDCDGISSAAIPVDRCGTELATCLVVFSKSRRTGELHTMYIK